jgi:uncharacterized membrane protein YphA (DoxX/SURF4 family)
MDVILTIHSINRWLIVTIALIAAVKYTIGWLGRHDYQSMDLVLMRGLTGSMDLQALLGIILIIGLGIEAYRIEHLITMVIAIVILHLSALWRNASDGVKYRNNLLVIVLSMLAVVLGVGLLPQGW